MVWATAAALEAALEAKAAARAAAEARAPGLGTESQGVELEAAGSVGVTNRDT